MAGPDGWQAVQCRALLLPEVEEGQCCIATWPIRLATASHVQRAQRSLENLIACAKRPQVYDQILGQLIGVAICR